jgi:LysM repeat protein
VRDARADQITYLTQQHDTLTAVAQRYGTTVNALATANHIVNPNLIRPGMRLIIVEPGPALAAAATPLTGLTYVVQRGDTLTSISQRYGVRLQTLSQVNALGAPFLIRTGQSILVPNPRPSLPVATATAAAVPSSTVQPPATATPTAASTATGPLGGVVYTVVAGDTLSALAGRFNVSIAAIATANNIDPTGYLSIGQALSIPAVQPVLVIMSTPAPVAAQPVTTYVVQPGDTLSGIGWQFGTSADALAARNGLSTTTFLQVGQSLIVPGGQEPFVTKGEVENVLTSEALGAGIDPALVKAIAWQESGWQMVTAADGGMGVMQLMPDSVTWASTTLLGYTVNPYNMVDNIRAGVAMLHYYLGVYPDAAHAIAAYHQGMASVDNLGILPETQSYVANVLALQQQFGG